MNKKYIADFVFYGNIVIELKAIDRLLPEHISQVLNYLKATEMNLGLLINFGARSLQFKRVHNNKLIQKNQGHQDNQAHHG